MTNQPSVRPPLQARSRETLDRIVEATREVLAERGQDAVTVKEVVRRSGTSVGSFYHRFSSKEDLLRYLDEHLWEDALERWGRLWHGPDGESFPQGGSSPGEATGAPDVPDGLGPLMERAVRALFSAVDGDPAIRGAMASSSVGGAGKGGEGAREFLDTVSSDLRSAVLARSREVGRPDPDAAADVAVALLLGAVLRLPAGEAGDLDPAPELALAVAGYLRGDSAVASTIPGVHASPESGAREAPPESVERPPEPVETPPESDETPQEPGEHPGESDPVDPFDVWG